MLYCWEISGNLFFEQYSWLSHFTGWKQWTLLYTVLMQTLKMHSSLCDVCTHLVMTLLSTVQMWLWTLRNLKFLSMCDLGLEPSILPLYSRWVAWLGILKFWLDSQWVCNIAPWARSIYIVVPFCPWTFVCLSSCCSTWIFTRPSINEKIFLRTTTGTTAAVGEIHLRYVSIHLYLQLFSLNSINTQTNNHTHDLHTTFITYNHC